MRARIRFELAVMAAVAAAFAGFLALFFVTVGPTDPEEGYLPVLIVWAVFATPSLIAARLLCRAWWARRGAALSALDGPACLLASAVAALPGHRREWAAAMTAELDQVRGRAARWRFAVGCGRAALFAPSADRGPALAGVVTVAAAPTAGLAVGKALPAMQLFTVTFLALVGALTALALARSHGPVKPSAGPAVIAVGLAGVAASIALAVHVLVQDPPAARTLGSLHAVVFAAVLACCLWLTLAPPRALTVSRFTSHVGIGTALVLGVCFLLTARSDRVWDAFLFLAPCVISFLGSATAAVVRRSFGAGVQTTVWTALTGTLLLFTCWMVEALHRYRATGELLLDGDTANAVGVNVADAVFWVLVFIPAWGLLPFGIMGAALGARLTRLLNLVP